MKETRSVDSLGNEAVVRKSGHMRSCEANCTQKKTFPRFEEIGKATCDPSVRAKGEEGKWERSGDRSVDRRGQVGSNAGQMQLDEVV